MPIRILVLHGPNLNLITDRSRSLSAVDTMLMSKAFSLGCEIRSVQSNHEGALIDALQAERVTAQGVIVNAGSMAPIAFALAETIRLCGLPTMEVLLEQPGKHRSALAEVVDETFAGRGFDSYVAALDALGAKIGKKPKTIGAAAKKPLDPSEMVTTPRLAPKSIGRKPAPVKEPPKEVGKKSIGRSERAVVTNVGNLSRDAVRTKIADRLSGKLSPAGLATWAREQWQALQGGAPAESGSREQLEDILQTLLLSASSKANDHQLIELMTQLA